MNIQFKSQAYINPPKHIMADKQNTKTQDTIIRIHIISRIHWMFALVVASTALQSQLPMGFTLPLTRLVFKHLRPLFCQRLGPLAILTTWVSTLYVRLTDSLECQDAILTWILTKLYNEAPPRTFVELHPKHEAPPWAPTNKGHGITSWPWGTTTKPSWNYFLTNEAPPWDLT